MITYWLTHLLQRYDLPCWKFCMCFVQKLKGQMRTGFKMRMWSVIMFASLPQAVHFFSQNNDQYNIVVAFLHLNMLQAVQFVQYTVRQNKHSPQTTNATCDGSCNRRKQNHLDFLPFYTGCISLFFKKLHNFLFINVQNCNTSTQNSQCQESQ
jgi:hypothetical protein